MNRFYSPLINPLIEGVDTNDLVIATYLMGATMDEEPVLKAVSMAIEQTTGSWADVPEETEEVRAKYCGKVLSIYEVPDYENETTAQMSCDRSAMRYYVVRIGFPVDNIEDNIPLLLASIAGNITALPCLRILDIDFPAKFTDKFQGPKFGLQGVRDVLGVQGRPLLNNMIKPCTGYTPDVGAKLFFEAAAGGVDIIKDDELIAGDRVFNSLTERVKKNMDAARRAEEVKGEKTLYTVNITDEMSRLKDNAYRAIDAGANALMVDAFGIGLSAMRMLAEDPNVNVPILAHICFGMSWTTSPIQGISSFVLNKLLRICGADIILTECGYGKFDISFAKYIKCIHATNSPFHNLKPALPFVGGGVVPGLVPQLLDDIGPDVLFGVGAGIHAHPMGPRAGAIAFRVAFDALMAGKTLHEAAADSPELKASLDKWGIYGEDKLKENYAL